MHGQSVPRPRMARPRPYRHGQISVLCVWAAMVRYDWASSTAGAHQDWPCPFGCLEESGSSLSYASSSSSIGRTYSIYMFVSVLVHCCRCRDACTMITMAMPISAQECRQLVISLGNGHGRAPVGGHFDSPFDAHFSCISIYIYIMTTI